jgi:hypothetical protein
VREQLVNGRPVGVLTGAPAQQLAIAVRRH